MMILSTFFFISSNSQVDFEVKNQFHQNIKHHISTILFYKVIEELILSKCISNVHIEIIILSEGGWFSRRRKYLKISKDNIMFLVCGFQLGTMYSVSYRQGVKKVSWIETILADIPLFGCMAGTDSKEKTYYQKDAENSFKSIVHSAVVQAIEEFNNR